MPKYRKIEVRKKKTSKVIITFRIVRKSRVTVCVRLT